VTEADRGKRNHESRDVAVHTGFLDDTARKTVFVLEESNTKVDGVDLDVAVLGSEIASRTDGLVDFVSEFLGVEGHRLSVKT
jgi:hypothetical protein